MDLYGKKDKSIPQKTIIIILEILVLGVSYWILFKGGFNKLFPATGLIKGNESRHVILFVFNITVFFRICITMFYFIKRRIPWEEAFSIPFAFAIYYIGFALLGYKYQNGIDLLDIFGIILFIFGSYLNTGSEFSRNKWKKNPENKKRLYTTGLFKYSIHINYFGDILWVTAYSLLTKNWFSALIPLFLFLFFAFYNIPKLDKHLASEYGEQFEEFNRKTKNFIPFIY